MEMTALGGIVLSNIRTSPMKWRLSATMPGEPMLLVQFLSLLQMCFQK